MTTINKLEWRSVWISLVLVALGAASLQAEAGTTARGSATLRLAPNGFRIEGKILEDKDVSSISKGTGSLGIIASDEGSTIQVVSFKADGSGIVILQNHALNGPSELEADFEGSTFLDGWFYVTGSHGVQKKSGTYQASRTHVYRFRLSGESSTLTDIQVASLAPLLAKNSILGPYFNQPLQQKGLNIEGLSAKDGKLYFGLRSPNLNGNAFVMTLSPEALFEDKVPEMDVLPVPLKAGLGIRAMTSLRDGFLLIAGNAGSEGSKNYPVTEDYINSRSSELYFWQPSSHKVLSLGTLPHFKKGKEEAILVLSGSDAPDATVEVLILYDGIAGANPQRFLVDVPK